MTAIRLNLGCGDSPIDGYENWDIKQGKKAYPLDLPDNHAYEVRVSHLLEHFGHRGASKIITEWVRVLKPGGLLKIAVPDLETIATKYLAGEPGNYQGWLSGGQVDPLDSHLAQYDWNSLGELLRSCGLVGIHRWQGRDDCSSLPISLNMAGYKRPPAWPKVIAVMSRPRLGFGDQFDCAMNALPPMGISVLTRTGAYYGQSMTTAIETVLDHGVEMVLTLDYDTLFTRNDVEDLLAFAAAAPDMDAFVPAQMTRADGRENPLLFNAKAGVTVVTLGDMEQTYYPIRSGHFGCTLLRASAINKMGKPWFFPTFHDDGRRKYDDDINFWIGFEKAGCKAVLVPRVVVGHLELVAMWPDKNLKMRYQRTTEYSGSGKPRDVWR